VVLVSKFGHPPDSEKDFSVGRFWKSLEDTLARLRTDRLDVLVLHNPPEEMYGGADPLWEYLERAKEQGKVLHYGASLDFAREAEACLDNTGSEVLEILFNILHQDIRRAFPRIRTGNAGTVVKVPLDSGWLTGRFDANSRFSDIRDRWSENEKSRRAGLVEALEWLTADGSKLAHKAIGYLLSYPEVTCVIPGIRTLEQLHDNLAAAECTVADTERDRLETFWEEITDDGRNLLPW
jgi:aryl-alcohol dehydrogenase-like predicted oxidoreductase